MLSIHPIRDVNYYQQLTAIDDYYGSVKEPGGRWLGMGAAAFELKGEVATEDLANIFSGFSPTGDKLVQNAGKFLADDKKGHRPGWDLTFSASKTVSVLWALSNAETRTVIEACHEVAVDTTLLVAEKECGWSRRGKGGRTVENAKLIVAAYQHGTSRALDPNLHTHCLVANLGVCEDEKVRALVSQTFYRWKMTLGQVYQNEFANQLQGRLGVAVKSTANGFEIQGIPKRLADHFSKRRAQIEEQLRRTGRFSAKAAEIAALETRRRKGDESREALIETWREVAAELGFTQEDALQLTHQLQAPLLSDKVIDRRIKEAIDQLTQSQAHFTKREILRSVINASIGQGATSGILAAAVERYLNRSPDIVHLQEINLERQFTTQNVLACETSLLRAAKRLSEVTAFSLPADILRNALETHSGVASRVEQERAVREIVSPGRMKLLTGGPGTGKTFVLDAAREAWERAGYRVIGTSLAGKAAKELSEKSKIPSDTIAKLLMDLDATPFDTIQHHANEVVKAALRKPTRALDRVYLDSSTVLVIDEAGMLDTPHLDRIMQYVERCGAKVVLVGDPQQLPPIGAGSPFRALLSRHTHERLTNNERQRDEGDRAAIQDLAFGRVREAVERYEKRDRLAIAPDRSKAREKLTEDWKTYGGLREPALHRIFVATNADRIAINDRCQKLRIEQGILNPDESLTVRRRESVEGRPTAIIREDFHVGDPVLCLQRSRSLGLENGTSGIVTSIDREERTLTIETDTGTSKKRQQIPLSFYPHITRGYAQTTHKGQGQTVDYSYILLGGPMQTREMTYVQISRAKHATRLYADALDVGPNREGLYAMLERSAEKLLAHDLLTENKELVRQAPPPPHFTYDDNEKKRREILTPSPPSIEPPPPARPL